MISRRVAVILCLLTPLVACVSGSNSSTPTPFQAKFVPLDAIMPFPNDLYFNGSKTGTLNIPASANNSVQAQESEASLLELNHLDGFGTQSDINIYFNEPVDATTLASNVLVFKVSSSATTKAVNPVAPAGTGSMSQLKEGTDYSIALSPGTDTGGETVTIKPLKPLAASTVSGTTPVPATYLVVVTNGVKDTNGDAVGPSSDYASILAADLPVLAGQKMGTTGNTQLDQVAEFTLPQLIDAAAAKIDPSNIAVSFSFSTAYLGISLAELSATATATAQPGAPTPTIIDTSETVAAALTSAGETPPAAAALAELFAGTVTLPYYLTVPKTGSTTALTDSWHNAAGGDTAISATDPTSFAPKATTNVTIPILVSIPDSTSGCVMPGTGWPVVIFQHGITRNREDMLAVAGSFASACMAVVAIDLPLHGVTDIKDPLYQNQVFATLAPNLVTGERTFNMGMTGAAGATGATGSSIDTSGAWFINLTSTITSRDNLREGAADLINLAATLPTMGALTPPSTVNTFDGSKIFFVGHSLGGIVGTTFLGADTAGHVLGGPSRIVAATLANPGGHIAELLRNSPEFEPIIDAQLQTNGIIKGTQFYYDFYSEAQAVVEDGDPANYAAAAALGHPIHMLEVIGNGTSTYPTDQVVPNSATELLASVMGLPKITTTTITPTGAHGLVQFIFGDHGSILDPSAPTGATAAVQANYAAVTTEMQTEMVVFAAGNLSPALPGNGETILISNSAVVKQ
ncbi:MAG TPA: alpha/beta fold hydrolase [Gammaproteobacteria bacterium]|nr:alpha/beta fold hydrolase [Gammaproteobacteria bacterium]